MEDRFGHRISYLRVSITDRCNERCTYCMPQELQEWLPRQDILTFEETIRLIRIASELGVTKIRLTGGEPLTRRDVLQLFRQLPRLTNVRDIGLSTNGTLLTREAEPGLTMAAAVRACGFNSVNISLDTLDRAEYARVTGRDLLPDVIAGIDAAIAAGFPQIKINCVLMRGRNLDAFGAADRFRGGAESPPSIHRVDASQHDRGPDGDEFLASRAKPSARSKKSLAP